MRFCVERVKELGAVTGLVQRTCGVSLDSMLWRCPMATGLMGRGRREAALLARPPPLSQSSSASREAARGTSQYVIDSRYLVEGGMPRQ